MNTDITTGTTELFYDLMDLTEQEQQIYLNKLKSTSPSKYHQVIQLFSADKNSIHSEQSWINLFSYTANELMNETPIHQLCDQQIGKYRLNLVFSVFLCSIVLGVITHAIINQKRNC